MLVAKRRSLLNYLKDRDIERYRAIVKELGLRKYSFLVTCAAKALKRRSRLKAGTAFSLRYNFKRESLIASGI